MGPRQVGKTTVLKILVHDLLKQRDPRSVFYYSCNELSDYRELGEVLDNYFSAKNSWLSRKAYLDWLRADWLKAGKNGAL